jgi:cytochrome c-type biogenesis protein CcmH/NrfG
VEILLGALLLALVGAFVLRPLFAARSAGGDEDPALADLELRKEAKYREIRDAELDHAAGKLSDEDFERQRAELRREALEILSQLERLRDEAARPGRGSASG